MRGLTLAVPLTVLLVGCGPVEYIGQVTRRASAEVAAAKSAGADKYAPYEYTSAIENLHKAREEAGYADYQAAIRFGKRAEEQAKKAKEIALKSAGTEPSAPDQNPIDPSATPPAPEPSQREGGTTP